LGEREARETTLQAKELARQGKIAHGWMTSMLERGEQAKPDKEEEK
jgi:hypothetical protein